jgi:hypothetical protein
MTPFERDLMQMTPFDRECLRLLGAIAISTGMLALLTVGALITMVIAWSLG